MTNPNPALTKPLPPTESNCKRNQKKWNNMDGLAGDEQGAPKFFTECASLTNPLVEYEWYLAKGEATSLS